MSFVRELSDGLISEQDLAARADVLDVFGSRPVPRAGLRIAQRVAMKAGLRDYEAGFRSSVVKARRAMLGARASGPPRFLIRVDEFPDAAGLDAPERATAASPAFHETLAAHGVPYLMAIVPQHTHRYLDPSSSGDRPLVARDHAFIEQMGREGVTFAQHGTSHRTRYESPRRRSELSGLAPHELDALIDDGLQRLAQAGVTPRVFVPPFNRFDVSQFSSLARRFDVIGGGPENVPLMGFHGGPLWRGDAVFLPSYPPFYASAAALSPVIDRVVGSSPGTWIPIVLHVSWEVGDSFRSLGELAAKIAPYAVHWDQFLAAVDASRTPIVAQATAGPAA